MVKINISSSIFFKPGQKPSFSLSFSIRRWRHICHSMHQLSLDGNLQAISILYKVACGRGLTARDKKSYAYKLCEKLSLVELTRDMQCITNNAILHALETKFSYALTFME